MSVFYLRLNWWNTSVSKLDMFSCIFLASFFASSLHCAFHLAEMSSICSKWEAWTQFGREARAAWGERSDVLTCCRVLITMSYLGPKTHVLLAKRSKNLRDRSSKTIKRLSRVKVWQIGSDSSSPAPQPRSSLTPPKQQKLVKNWGSDHQLCHAFYPTVSHEHHRSHRG